MTVEPLTAPRGWKGAAHLQKMQDRVGQIAHCALMLKKMPNLKQKYRTEIAPVLMREFDFANVMEAPRVQKVVINIGIFFQNL